MGCVAGDCLTQVETTFVWKLELLAKFQLPDALRYSDSSRVAGERLSRNE
jgi:hypothetical protein